VFIFSTPGSVIYLCVLYDPVSWVWCAPASFWAISSDIFALHFFPQLS